MQCYFYIFDRTVEHLEAINTLVGSEMTDTAVLAAQSAEMASIYQSLMKYLLMFLGVIFAVWIVSQGIDWFICSKIAMRKKIDLEYFGEHMLKFIVLSVFWTAVSLMIALLSAWIAMSSIETFGWLSLAIAIILFVLMLYFMLISYAVIPRYSLAGILQKSFKLGAAHFREIAPVFLFAILLTAVLLFVLAQTFALEETIFLAFFAVIFLPAMSYIRVLYVKTAEKLKDN